ncbi:MAG TPA: GatB/YqeY domain-containing protein [Patescibacteria group bacterium]|nr:GatB/YqeY domain-containing protein [Patescibacteria group bacterium]
MELLKKIEQDFQKATKNAKDIEKRVLRNLKSQIQNKKIELRSKGEELKEADLFKLLKKQAKKHKESIEIFKKGNRDDLAEKEEKELNFLSKYLPEELSDEKIKDIVMSTIKEIGEKTPRVFGQVMGKVMKEVKGKADGTRVKKIVDKILKE